MSKCSIQIDSIKLSVVIQVLLIEFQAYQTEINPNLYGTVSKYMKVKYTS